MQSIIAEEESKRKNSEAAIKLIVSEGINAKQNSQKILDWVHARIDESVASTWDIFEADLTLFAQTTILRSYGEIILENDYNYELVRSSTLFDSKTSQRRNVTFWRDRRNDH